LREANLAQETEFIAQAALARRPETSVTALSTLAGRGDGGEAFRWMWSLVARGGGSSQRLQVVLGGLPAPVTVPVDLEDSLEQFLLCDVPGRGSSPWESLLAGLLGHLDPAADVTEQVACSYAATRTGERREAGLDTLAAHAHEASRAVMLDYAESLSYNLAPAALERLRPPSTETSVQWLLQLLGELRQRATVRIDAARPARKGIRRAS
jgi:hypothetical protein